MAESFSSMTDRELKHKDDLAFLLEDLRDLDLSEEIFDETPYLSAHGGYCDIFTAKSRRHGNTTVAMKRLRIHILHNKDASKIILRELRIWSSMKHTNLLPLLGYVMHGAYPAFISRWMVNGSVCTYMQNNSSISPMYMVTGITEGLLYLHTQGVIHSDLKSDNILISDDGKPLLADFGLSHIMCSSTTTTTGVGGSVRWMAVELLDPRPTNAAVEAGKHTAETDVWAYGMVIYELLTGNVPFFELKNDIQVALAIVDGQTPSRPSTLWEEHIDPVAQVQDMLLLWVICRHCWKVPASSRPRVQWIYNVLASPPIYQKLKKGKNGSPAISFEIPVISSEPWELRSQGAHTLELDLDNINTILVGPHRPFPQPSCEDQLPSNSPRMPHEPFTTPYSKSELDQNSVPSSRTYAFDDPATVDFRTFYPYNPSEVKHRKRTTRNELKLLEETFKRETKPNAALQKTLAAQLEMTPRGVQVWFQNRRAKENSLAKRRQTDLVRSSLLRDTTNSDDKWTRSSGQLAQAGAIDLPIGHTFL